MCRVDLIENTEEQTEMETERSSLLQRIEDISNVGPKFQFGCGRVENACTYLSIH